MPEFPDLVTSVEHEVGDTAGSRSRIGSESCRRGCWDALWTFTVKSDERGCRCRTLSGWWSNAETRDAPIKVRSAPLHSRFPMVCAGYVQTNSPSCQ